MRSSRLIKEKYLISRPHVIFYHCFGFAGSLARHVDIQIRASSEGSTSQYPNGFGRRHIERKNRFQSSDLYRIGAPRLSSRIDGFLAVAEKVDVVAW